MFLPFKHSVDINIDYTPTEIHKVYRILNPYVYLDNLLA